MRRVLSLLLAAAMPWLVPAPSAVAGGNDLDLLAFGRCIESPASTCVRVVDDEAGFVLLARDMGLAIMPLAPIAADTLGVAGFTLQLVHGLHGVDTSADHWRAAENPGSGLSTTHISVRKGLPYSVDIGAHFGTVWNSELYTIGADLRIAIDDSPIIWVPDFAIRGFASTMVGHPQFNLLSTGADFLIGKSIGIGHVVNITPFAGYGLSVIVASTRLIDADPEVNRQAVTNTDNPNASYQSEFAFSPDADIVHRGIAGLRFQFAVGEIAYQAQVSETMIQHGIMLGLRF